MGEDAGDKVGRPVPLQPGGLVGGQRECGSVGLAEPEGRERGQHLPDAFGHRFWVATQDGPGQEPVAGLLLALEVAQRAADLVPLGQAAAGDHRDDLDDLLMEDHHPVGRLQYRRQARMQVTRGRPTLPGVQEGHHHVGLHRAGPEQRDVDDDVVEVLGPELADQLTLAGRLDLEAAKGLGVGDHVVDPRVAEGGQRVHVGHLLGPAGAFDLGQTVGD